MTEIFIDPTKKNIGVQVTSQSIHALGFEIIVFDTDAITVIEKFTGDTKVDNPFTKNLAKTPADYKGAFIRGAFSVKSPDGKDYPYSILFSILEEDVIIKPNVTLTDTTTGGQDTTITVYHIN